MPVISFTTERALQEETGSLFTHLSTKRKADSGNHWKTMMDVPMTQRIIKSSVLDAIKQKGCSHGTRLLLFINTQRQQAANTPGLPTAHHSPWSLRVKPSSSLFSLLKEAASYQKGREGRSLGSVERCQPLPVFQVIAFPAWVLVYQQMGLKCPGADAFICKPHCSGFEKRKTLGLTL